MLQLKRKESLVQTTRSELDHLYRLQNACDNGVSVDTLGEGELGWADNTVDPDFQQALETSVVSL